MSFKEIWFRKLSPEDKQSLERALRNSILSNRLREILNDWEASLIVRKDDYDSPSWSHRQAHMNGEQDVILKLKSLLTEDQR
jgi:hypothetical protein